jgi:hypothetical protein
MFRVDAPLVAGVLVLIAQLIGASVFAHETGFGHVVVSFPSPREYAIDLTVDAQSLLARLENEAGLARSEGLSQAEYPERIAALQQGLLKHTRVRFDGIDAVLSLESVRVTGTVAVDIAPQVIVRLRGEAPQGARAAVWRYDLTYASYAFTVKAGASAASTEWLEGGQESRAWRVPVADCRPWLSAGSIRCLSVVPLLLLAALPFRRARTDGRWSAVDGR